MWKENSTPPLVYLVTLELKQNLIICRQFRKEMKGMDNSYIKSSRHNKIIKAEAYLHFYASENSYKRYF